MKAFFKKIEHNKFLFALFMVIAFVLFKLITTGFNGAFGFGGIIHYFMDVAETTDAGQSLLGEILWGLCLLPVLIIFGNRYIFSQKGKPFKERIKVTWPMLIIIGVFLINGLSYIAFSRFNIDEFFASLLLYFFVGIYEEFLCRGWLLNEFMERFGQNRKGLVYSVILSALLFGLMHITNIFVGQSVAETISQIVMATAIGIYLGVVYLKTRNIWSVVILHGLYDFSLSLTNVNITNSCFIPTGNGDLVGAAMIGTAISGILINLFIDAACVFIAMKYFTKMGANEIVYGEPIALDQNEIRKSKAAKKTFNILAIIFASLSGSLLLLGAFTKPDEDVCLNYQTKEVYNYEITTMNVNNYKVNYKSKQKAYIDCIIPNCEETVSETSYYEVNYNYMFSVNSNTLDIKNIKEDSIESIKYHNILRFAVYKNKDSYVVMLVDNVENGTEVHYIEFDSSKLADKHFTKYFKTNFKKLDLPVVLNVGYLTENDTKHPLFKTIYDTYYILDTDGDIKLLEIK